MVLLGTLVNAAAIVIGGLLGLLVPRLDEGIRRTVMQGIGISVMVLGVSMALRTDDFLLVIASLVIGGIAGELLKVEKGLQSIGVWMERKVDAKGNGKFAGAFVSTTLLYCVGAMAILGSLDSGLKHDHEVLYTKAMLDGFSAVIFASTLGLGVVFSSIPVLLYQGSIALAATGITMLISQGMLDSMITQITATGGVLIIGIGLNLLEIKRVSVGNLLPAVFVAAAAVPLVDYVSGLAIWH